MTQRPTTAKLIDDGIAAHQAGDLDGASQKFEAALADSPNDPEALHLLGLMHELRSDRARAIMLIECAIAADPAEPLFRLNLASIFEKTRQFDAAVNHLLAALESIPNASDIWAKLGDIELLRNGKTKAAAAYRRAYELDARNIYALAGFGLVMLFLGNVAEAERAADAAFRASPNDPAALKLALHIASRKRNWRAVNQIADKWKTASISDQKSLRDLARELFDLGFTQKARSVFETVVELGPKNIEILTEYGRYCTAAQEFDLAEKALAGAIAIDPRSPRGLYAMSRLSFLKGDLQSADEYCVRALDADPAFAPALIQLSELRRGEMSDEHIAVMNGLASDDLTAPDRAFELLLALGKIYDRRGMIAEAIATLKHGNAIGENSLRETGGGYNHATSGAEVDHAISFFDCLSQQQQFEAGPAIPIFVVGMPRSGTTLIESILAAHPDVYGAGELASLPAVFQDVLAWLAQTGATSITAAPKEIRQMWRNHYFSHYPNLSDAKYVTDKQPLNARIAGLIPALFPEGKIIHVRRNPVETGFSIYRNPFNKQWPFAYQLKNIAHYYGDYARLVAHWEKTLGSDFPLFQYEDLIADFEPEVRRLLSHCGLDFREECLEFHRSQRPIATFSAIQARLPVRKEPERAALRYAEFLKPLREGLITANVDLETGALR